LRLWGCAGSLNAVQEPAAPRRIGNYEIVSHLKAGGMATLYLARRTGAAGFARHVAIKVVHPHLAQNQSFVRMFLDEAFLSARIQHPNVVHVEELGEADGVYFLVMEYVHGAALSQLLKALAVRRRRLTPELATWIAIQIADGLHAAHELRGDDEQLLQVVHRDVSPQNVLLSYAGHVKVIDFGIAKARTRAKETTTKSLKGKLRYMAPEQAFGKPVDRRTDIYALGIVLWELLTVRRLFEADDDFALLDQVRSPVLFPPSHYADGISPALDAAVLRALAPKMEDRPATMQDFRRLLAEAVPSAMSVDAAHIADLLGAVMTDEIAKQKQTLPDSLSALRAISALGEEPGTRAGNPASLRAGAIRTAQLPPEEREEILRTMTYRAENASLAADEDDEPSVGARTPPPVAPTITHTERYRVPQKPQTGLHVVAGAGIAVLLVATGLGITWTVLRSQAAPTATSAGELGLPPILPPSPLPTDLPTVAALPVAPLYAVPLVADAGPTTMELAQDEEVAHGGRHGVGRRRAGATTPTTDSVPPTEPIDTLPPPTGGTSATKRGTPLIEEADF